ncbi:site-specific integrase [Pigmentiphaga soli]|uniref:Site-specific integrase n=1 Tax=Pigmentiphaga soli TaxID=1007095 RepID=A0ABP8GCE0_9BURK
MPSYRKRGDTWRAEIMRHGRRESATFPTKREAQEWATRREAELAAVRGGKVIRRTLAEVMQKYAEEVSPGKAGERWERTRIAAISRDPLAEMTMQDIGPADLAAWRDRRLAGTADTPAVKGATVLRDIALLRAIWRRARMGEWRFVDHDPWPDVEKPADSRARTTTFQPGQAERIVEALGYEGGTPADKRQQAAVALLLALETAMRAGELLALRWEYVHLDRRVAHLPATKNGDPRDVPLSRCAVELLEAMQGVDEERVFTLSSALLDVYFRQGRALAGIEGPTFHDARATAITRLAKKLDLLELARMVGHRDPRSLLVYYRASAADIASRLD